MNYSRAYRDELYELLKKYPEHLTVYYNDYGDMDTFSKYFMIRENILYLCTNNNELPLTVKDLIEILETATDKNMEISTYTIYSGRYNFHCNMILDNIYFK